MNRMVIGVLCAFVVMALSGRRNVLLIGQGLSASCGMQKNDAPVAFCETFDHPFAATNRSGQLDGTFWGVSRLTGVANEGQGEFNAALPSTLDACGGTQPAMPDGTDVVVCGGQLRESTYDDHTVTTLALYPKQPFDFANRTGTVAFDVSNDTYGSHSFWPEFWLTDQPVPAPFTHGGPPCDFCSIPRNGLGIRLSAAFAAGQGGQAPNCPSDNNRRWLVDSFVIVRNYVVEERPMCCPASGRLTVGCSIASSGPNGGLNHIELRISQEQVEVWATDPGTTGLQLLARTQNANLTFTRGLAWIEDSHYNPSKSDAPGPNPNNHTFAWDNVAFDGPVLARDLSLDVLDGQVPGPGGTVNLGFLATPSVPAGLRTLPMTAGNIAATTGSLLLFNFQSTNNPVSTFTYSINGVASRAALPSPQPGWRSAALPVATSSLVPGAQTIAISGDQDMIVANVDVVLVGAGGVQGGHAPAAPVNLRIKK